MLGRPDKTKLVEKQEKELVFRERRGPCWTADLESLQLLQKDFNFHGQVKRLG